MARLHVELVGARGLLPADGLVTDGASSRDPYGELQVNAALPRPRSATRRHTRDPDFDFTPASPFVVPHPSSVLRVHIYDEGDVLHSDVLLGCAHIELRRLPWNTPVDLWLELSNGSGDSVAAAAGDAGNNNNDTGVPAAAKQPSLLLPHQPSQRLPPPSSLSSTLAPPAVIIPGLPTSPKVRHPYGIIQLRIMFETSWLHQFTSGFRSAPATAIDVPPEFHATLCYNNLVRCLDYVNPLLEGAEEVSNIQRWVSPLKSMSVLLAWVLLMRNSDYFPVVLHLWLLFKMAAGYVQKHTSDHPHRAYRVDKIRQHMSPYLPSAGSGAFLLSPGAGGDGQSLRNSNNKIEKGGGLGGFVDALATWLLGMGLGAQLEAAQNAMGSTADGLDTVAALFTWKDVHTSRNVCAGLFVSGAFLYLFPTRWLLVCVTVWLMLSSTMLYGVVVRALAGLSGLLARSPNADTMVKDGQIRGLLKVRVRGGGGGAQGESAGGGRRFVAKKKAQ